MTPEVFGGFHVRRLKSSKNTNHVIICNIFSVYKCNMRSDSPILIPFHHPFDMLSPLRFLTGCTDTSYPLWPMPFPPTKKKKHILPFFRRWKSKIFRCWIFLPRLSANSWSMKPDPSEVSKCAVGLPFAMPSRRGTGINVEFGHVETKKKNGWKPPVLKTEIMIRKSSFSLKKKYWCPLPKISDDSYKGSMTISPIIWQLRIDVMQVVPPTICRFLSWGSFLM